MSLAAAGAVQDHHELVAAEAHAQIRGAAGIAHALCRNHQHIVAGGMAERVVDLLETVEVELDHRQAFAPAIRRSSSARRNDRSGSCGYADRSARHARR